jgi:redox-sensitive bicupin YhaK (pirin superfamily)
MPQAKLPKRSDNGWREKANITHQTYGEKPMSTLDAQPSSSLDCLHMNGEKILQRVVARSAEIGGGISVNRLLPSRQRRTIGAWCFLDHAGPAVFASGAGMHVGPHPHIGLQTFTWMIEGEAVHRDSLGNVQVIRPGQVNLMTAGRGISHTEDSASDQGTLHAAQLWIALPPEAKDCAPAFDHYPDLPQWDENGCRYTLLAGQYKHRNAPARIYSALVGIDLYSRQGAAIELDLDPAFEYGLMLLEGGAQISGESFTVNELAYLGCGAQTLQCQLSAGSRAILIGGEPLKEEIQIWWNFVGHSKAEIAQAHRDWEAAGARFGRIEGYEGGALAAPAFPWPGY